ncbi:MAG: hypothetical protein EBU53_03395, partial [Proteobacteria bacterium]|nr:hypothetical protein [Pseudomonadota bacterium]
LAHHVGRNGDGPVADQVSAAGAQAEGDQLAPLIPQAADVVPPQPGGPTAAGQPDLLLDRLLAGHVARQ